MPEAAEEAEAQVDPQDEAEPLRETQKTGDAGNSTATGETQHLVRLHLRFRCVVNVIIWTSWTEQTCWRRWMKLKLRPICSMTTSGSESLREEKMLETVRRRVRL